MNHPISSLNNVPNEYRDIKDVLRAGSPIILSLIKMLLSTPDLLVSGFISRYPSEDILIRGHEIFYDITIDAETMGLILQRLPELGVENISYIIHSNSSSYRTYF